MLLVIAALSKPVAMLGVPLLYFGLIAYALAQFGNMVYNRARLAGNGCKSELRARSLYALPHQRHRDRADIRIFYPLGRRCAWRITALDA